ARCGPAATGGARAAWGCGSGPWSGPRLALAARVGVGGRFEPLERDAAARRRADAVGLVPDALERAVDVVDDLARRRRQQQVALTLDVDRVAFAGLLVELRVAALALGSKLLRLGLELLRLVDV